MSHLFHYVSMSEWCIDDRGTSSSCPADARLPTGTPCDDGNPCTTDDQCLEQGCIGSQPEVRRRWFTDVFDVCWMIGHEFRRVADGRANRMSLFDSSRLQWWQCLHHWHVCWRSMYIRRCTQKYSHSIIIVFFSSVLLIPSFSLDTLCRAKAGACDIEERCDGASSSCPGFYLFWKKNRLKFF